MLNWPGRLHKTDADSTLGRDDLNYLTDLVILNLNIKIKTKQEKKKKKRNLTLNI
jgi:hypothetical protein